MIDHTGVVASDFEKSKAFYSQALAAIGYRLLADFPAAMTGHTDVAGYGEPPKPDFWISRGAPGPRSHSHPNCYGAFVLDPDGHNTEAVCHTPE